MKIIVFIISFTIIVFLTPLVHGFMNWIVHKVCKK